MPSKKNRKHEYSGIYDMYLIRKIHVCEVDEALALAFEIFMQFEAPDYKPDGVWAFKREIDGTRFTPMKYTIGDIT